MAFDHISIRFDSSTNYLFIFAQLIEFMFIVYEYQINFLFGCPPMLSINKQIRKFDAIVDSEQNVFCLLFSCEECFYLLKSIVKMCTQLEHPLVNANHNVTSIAYSIVSTKSTTKYDTRGTC